MRKLENKRGYFVNSVDEPLGFAVVATSAKEAKQIAYKSGKVRADSSDVAWIDLRPRWIKDADVDGLPIGMIADARDGLIRGFYGVLKDYPCDVCGRDENCYAYDDKAMCDSCMEITRTDNIIGE